MYELFSDEVTTLKIWDSDQTNFLGNEPLLLWQQFVGTEHPLNTVSISDIVEQNSAEIRTMILGFIYDVGENINSGAKSGLLIESEFNYYWMTQFHSRPYTQSAQLNNLAKIFALIKIVEANRFQKIVFITTNKDLTRVIASIARANNLDFKVVSQSGSAQSKPIKTKFKNLTPRPVLGLLALFQQIRSSSHLRDKDLPPTSNLGTIAFFDYWYRFGATVNQTRKFESQYWTALVDQLSNLNVNWFHNLVDQRRKRPLREAKSLLTDFNSADKNHQHQIIDASCSTSIVLKSLNNYRKILIRSLQTKKYSSAFTISDKKIELWPIFQREWLNSLRGYEAMINCLRFSRLNKILQKLPQQRIGFYLIENQPWEMALVHLWRKYGHGQLIGVAHSTVRFWDLRLMSDPRRFSNNTNNPMPRPDLIAVNGPLARESLIAAGYPATEIREVEALMYQHFADTPDIQLLKSKQSIKTILVATDYLESATQTQIKLLNDFLATNSESIRVLLKPHWSQSFRNLNPLIEIVSGKEDLSTYFDQCDVLYCSAITSAVIDGACAGLPVIQCLDPQSFNLSPLRGRTELQVLRTSKELKDALSNLTAIPPKIEPDTLFNLDPQLPRWKSLLGI